MNEVLQVSPQRALICGNFHQNVVSYWPTGEQPSFAFVRPFVPLLPQF